MCDTTEVEVPKARFQMCCALVGNFEILDFCSVADRQSSLMLLVKIILLSDIFLEEKQESYSLIVKNYVIMI